MAEDGRKMSKRRGNVVLPDDIIAEYGSDAFRTYEMFMGPFEQTIARSTNGIKGVKKLLDKIIGLYDKIPSLDKGRAREGFEAAEGEGLPRPIDTLKHQTIKKLTEDIDEFKFNTGISQLMIFVNALTDLPAIDKSTFQDLILLIAPFAPHLAEEFWEKLGNEYSIFTTGKWPTYDTSKLVADLVKIGVQINGKVRGTIEISPSATQDEVMKIVKQDEKLLARLTSEPKKIIYIPGKILNIVL